MSPGQKALTSADKDWLSKLAAECDATALTVQLGRERRLRHFEAPEPVLTAQADGSFRAGRFIGEVRRGERVLEIRPRLGLPVITHWANTALNLRLLPASAGNDGVGFLLAELQAAMWRRLLTKAIQHGYPATRAQVNHRGELVRGQLDIAGTIAMRAAGLHGIASVHKEKTLDNPASRAIVLAARTLRRELHRPNWQGQEIASLLTHLEARTGSRPNLPTSRELRRIRYTPMTLPYKRAVEFSWRIASGKALQSSASSDDYDGALLDVAELWELFLLHCVRMAVPENLEVIHGTTSSQTPLLQSSVDSSRTLGRLFPDILISDPAGPLAVIDAKYKRLTDPFPVAREDLYQLTSYVIAVSGGTRPILGMLAYPQFGNEEPSSAEALGPWLMPGVAHQQRVCFLRFPVDSAQCIAALADQLRSTSSGTGLVQATEN
jgi:5-methylcytosine-specific restriction enzyme subunit McrC